MLAPHGVLTQPQPSKEQQKLASIMQAIGLLRSDKIRGFRIDIETDSTIQGNAEMEKEQRIAFVQGVTKFVETAGQIIPQSPEFAPLAAKMLQFAVRGFRVGRDLETAIEDFCEKAEQHAKQAAMNPKPDPEQIKADTEKMKATSEIQRQQIENQGEERNAMLDLQSKNMDMMMKRMEMAIEALKAHAETKRTVMDSIADADQHKRDTELAEMTHKHKMAEVKNVSQPKA